MQNLTVDSVAFMFCMVKLFTNYIRLLTMQIVECLIIMIVLFPEPKRIIKLK